MQKHPQIPKERSLRISALRYPLIVGVVFAHAYTFNTKIQGEIFAWSDNSIGAFVQYAIAYSTARVTVPLFYAISAYLLFFRREGKPLDYKRVLRSRFLTLAVPFLFWNIMTLTAYAAVQASPVFTHLFSGDRLPVRDFGIFEYLDAILGIKTHPIAYQFWFLRDLIVLMIISPVIGFLANRAAILTLTGLTVFWTFDINLCTFLSSEAIVFFLFGAWLAITKVDLEEVDRYRGILFTVFMLLVVADASTHNFLIHKICVFTGVPAIYSIVGLAGKTLRSLLAYVSPAAFFLYAAHEPLLTLLKKLALKIIPPSSEPSLMAVYFLPPIIVIITVTLSYYILHRYFPKLTNFVTGSRV